MRRKVNGSEKKFTGYERDAETNLDFAQARYCSPTMGRFTSADPLSGMTADPQSLNRYSYAANNPLNDVDPDGRYPRSQHQFITFLMAAMLGMNNAGDIGMSAGNQDDF